MLQRERVREAQVGGEHLRKDLIVQGLAVDIEHKGLTVAEATVASVEEKEEEEEQGFGVEVVVEEVPLAVEECNGLGQQPAELASLQEALQRSRMTRILGSLALSAPRLRHF